MRLLLLDRDNALEAEKSLNDVAVVATRRYPRTASGAADEEQSWDEVLTAIDELLEARQVRHLSEVRAAQLEQARRSEVTAASAQTPDDE